MTNRRILIVEDEGIIAEDLRATLIESGYDVIGISESGEDALQQAQTGRPELISMDIKIRGQMDGIETASKIRKEMDIPIIFMTSTSDDETRTRAHAISPWFLVKPFNEEDFLQTAAKALGLIQTSER